MPRLIAAHLFCSMDYHQTIDYLYIRLPIKSRGGAAAYKPDLVNSIKLSKEVGDPHRSFKSIHVAGTNGKGSVSHMLAAILQSAGYKTGLYTSPHLKDFRERIRIDGEMISREFVIDFTEKTKTISEEIRPSFFELTMVMAFDYFAKEKVDIAVIETGLGGRLDSTNIIDPEISVITNIGWDHMHMLGDSLEQIATEKAGIIKDSVPVVVGEVLPETEKIFQETANKKNAPLTIASRNRHALNWYWLKQHLIVEVAQEGHTDHRVYNLDLPGIYQVKNLLTVLETCSVLKTKGWHIDEQHIQKGLEHTRKLTRLHGRWETIHHSPLVILDVAHNPDGISQLVQQLEVTDHNALHIVIGMVKDKEIDRTLGLLPSNANYYFTKAQIPRALPENELLEKAMKIGLHGKEYPEVNIALRAALEHADQRDLIIVCGSVFLVGEVSLSF